MQSSLQCTTPVSWRKFGHSDEGSSTDSHTIHTYRTVFIRAEPNFTAHNIPEVSETGLGGKKRNLGGLFQLWTQQCYDYEDLENFTGAGQLQFIQTRPGAFWSQSTLKSIIAPWEIVAISSLKLPAISKLIHKSFPAPFDKSCLLAITYRSHRQRNTITMNCGYMWAPMVQIYQEEKQWNSWDCPKLTVASWNKYGVWVLPPQRWTRCSSILHYGILPWSRTGRFPSRRVSEYHLQSFLS